MKSIRNLLNNRYDKAWYNTILPEVDFRARRHVFWKLVPTNPINNSQMVTYIIAELRDNN